MVAKFGRRGETGEKLSAKRRSTPYFAAEDVLCKQLLQAQKRPSLSVKEKIFISRHALSSFCIWSLSGFTRKSCVIFNLQVVTDLHSWNLGGQACERWQHERQLSSFSSKCILLGNNSTKQVKLVSIKPLETWKTRYLADKHQLHYSNLSMSSGIMIAHRRDYTMPRSKE